jgi:hypothetical protein
VLSDMLKKAVAGKAGRVRLNCKDAGNQPAVPGTNFTFGVTLVRANETDGEAWRRVPPETVDRNVIGDQIELSFVPRRAGEFKVFMWAEIVDVAGARSKSPGTERAGGSGEKPNRSSLRHRRRMGSARGSYNAASDRRKLLPGVPFPTTIAPAEMSVKNSYIDGIMQSVYGAWEDVADVTVAGKARQLSALAKKAEDDEAGAEEEEDKGATAEDKGLMVGDTIKISPKICDQFDNPVGARNGSLTLSLEGPRGKELIPIMSQCVRGIYNHDQTYELPSKGRFKLEVLLDDVPIQGSPIEWVVKPRTTTATGTERV